MAAIVNEHTKAMVRDALRRSKELTNVAAHEPGHTPVEDDLIDALFSLQEAMEILLNAL